MVHRQALTVRPAADLAHALELLELAARNEVTGGCAVRDLVGGCAVFELVDEAGAIVGAFAARVDTFTTGREVTVTAAGATGDNGATEAMADWVEHQARERIGARRLTCTTKRRGLVRKLQARGYRVAGYVMTKEI